MDTKKVKLIAFDLDGTLTQHKQPLTGKNLETMYQLAGKYKLVMAGAGQARRIFNQMGQFPIDIIANYGLQFAKYNDRTKDLDMVRNAVVECDRASIEARVTAAREKYGYTDFVGDNVEYHPSGCVTFPLLGTKADPADKLAFDPDRKKRRLIYEEIKSLFPEYNVFVGGSSSLIWHLFLTTNTMRWICTAGSTDSATMKWSMWATTTALAETMSPYIFPTLHSFA